LTQAEFEKLETEREAFKKDTRNLRENLYDRQVDLRRELAGESPDAKRASELQKEISGLRAELDQKRVDHLIKMRKIAPNAGKGGRGGYGSRGGRHCWE
jgi:Spy/CpxP family protein refolding chaperone